MDPRVLPLLLASERFIGEEESQPLDRLRMQKGVFLLEQRGPKIWSGLYSFSPYDWGPFSGDLVRDVDTLLSDGDLTMIKFAGFRYGEFRTTPDGEALIDAQAPHLDSQLADLVLKVRNFVTTRSFSQLLRDVYQAYPKYATRSRFTG